MDKMTLKGRPPYMASQQYSAPAFRGYFFLAILTSLLSIAGCSPLSLLNTFVPSDGYRRTADIVYGEDKIQKLDIYQPTQPCDHCPVLIWIHGGAWNSGEKEEYQFVGEAFASAGMLVVIPGYRKYPQVRFPGFIEDAASAVSWVRSNIQRYGGNPDDLNLMGHSAGAHIAMMLTFDPQYLAQVKVPLKSITTAIGLAGPYNFLPIDEQVIAETFATAVPLETSQPITYVTGENPPVLLAAGLKDKRVNPENTFSMARKIQEKGGEVKLVRYLEIGHPGILLSLSRPLRNLSSVYPDVLEFLKQHGQPAP